MLSRSHRWWIVLVMLLLALPMAGALVSLGRSSVAADEYRDPAPAPGWPGRRDWSKWPRRADAYLQDRFGLRHWLVLANSIIRYELGSGNDDVLIGGQGRLFYLSDGALAQSAGRLMRPQWLDTTVSVLTEMHRALAARGARLLVAVPPNATTMEQADLPGWARADGRPTEYQRFFAMLAARGIAAVDLRPSLAAVARFGKAYYRHDTHWTPLGALAGFNAVVSADGRPDWRVPLDEVKPDGIRRGGDLARMLGLGNWLTESEQSLDLPGGFTYKLLHGGDFQTFVATADHPAPTIMIVGDSFTQEFFLSPVMQHAGRLVWTHHQLCGFDWSLVDQFHPDEVWYMPTERFMPCPPGRRPSGLPKSEPGSARLAARQAPETNVRLTSAP